MQYKLIVPSLPAAIAMQWQDDTPNKCKWYADDYYPRHSCEIVDSDGNFVTSRSATGSWSPMQLPAANTGSPTTQQE